MVIYLDLVFLLNFAADALALYVTSRLSGITITGSRVILGSFIGGVYGLICAIPSASILCGFVGQISVAAILVSVVFGKRTIFLRLLLLFFVLSCAMVGIFVALTQMITSCGVSKTLYNMNWKVFFLAGGLCYFLLSVVFRGSAAHRVAGEIYTGSLSHNGSKTPLNILLDTGHTLSDPYTGTPVITIWLDAVENLWTGEEWAILSRLGADGAALCCEKLSLVSPGVFRVVPYRAVGTESGVLLCFTVDNLEVEGRDLGHVTAALTTTPLSDGGGSNALWGGNNAWEKERVR